MGTKGDVNADFGVPEEIEHVEVTTKAAISNPVKDEKVDPRDAEIAKLKAVIAKQEKDLAERNADSSISRSANQRRIRIVLAAARDSSEGQRVFASVNGRAYDMARNIPVDVPPEVVGVLNNAIQGRAQPHFDLKGNMNGVEFVDGHRFPFQVVGEAVDINGKQVLPPLEYNAVETRPN